MPENIPSPATDLQNFYFTFGYGHHDLTHPNLKDYCVIIAAPTEENARQSMFLRRGNRWATCYLEEAGKEQVAKWGYVILPFAELTEQPFPTGEQPDAWEFPINPTAYHKE